VTLDVLLKEADILSLHVPLNRGGSDNTYHLVDREFVAQVRKDAILINTSRGPVVDEVALMEGIGNSSFSEVVLDVFEHEPVLDPNLLDALSLATPHIAGYSLDGKANGTAMSVQALSRHFNFGMDDWQVTSLPLPGQAELHGDASQDQERDLMWDLLLPASNICVETILFEGSQRLILCDYSRDTLSSWASWRNWDFPYWATIVHKQ
jgi:erythronate-4-phosphate dehydrogenase